MARRRLDTVEYTVGWICALPVELAAAQVMLDEEHLHPDGISSAEYTLGCVGDHNVVLTCFQSGRMGTSPAAFSAGRLASTFPSIRFGLLVGVGGGVPSLADIRLGDDVVSQPFLQHSGVVQYDFGKTEPGGQIRRTGSLNSPPKELLHALSQLRARRQQANDGQDHFAEYLSAFDKQPSFCRKNAGADVLYEASYLHNGGSTCENCRSDSVVQREIRKDENVVIHYGTIASGNQVIKDATTRDRFSKELGGVLCFEMEAAGLMNDFPCLVVRGICDYADTHKNKKWQPYAASTAAACAKAILRYLPTTDPMQTAVIGAIRSYHVPFNLKGIPVGKFAERPSDTLVLEQELLPLSRESTKERRLLIAYGLGGIGKTQLAVNFARRHRSDFTSVLWLDGSSEGSIKQSFAVFASRISEGQIPEASRMYAAGQSGNTEDVVSDVLAWLSIPDNTDWLLVVDNVDQDDQWCETDAEGYKVEDFLPDADHGSILITTRLPHLCQLGRRWEVKKVDRKQAQAIFTTWYGRDLGEESNDLLNLLDGLPLALTQAAAYMSETGTTFAIYLRLYKEQWQELMQSRRDRGVPLRSYANGNVATTWTMSFMAVKSQNEPAANLLLLWAHLDNKSLWYGLLATATQKSPAAAHWTEAWFGSIARNEVDFIEAVRMLRRYSLLEEAENQTGHSTHPVVHEWALHMQTNQQHAALSRLAVVLVGLAVPMSSERKYWETQSQLFPHAERCQKYIAGLFTDAESEQQIFTQEQDREALLWAVNNFGILYTDKGVPFRAEEMYTIALKGSHALGEEHLLTLRILDNLGNLYRDQGALSRAETMYTKALHGRSNILGEDDQNQR